MEKKYFGFSERGFNMFSAVVAVILLMTSVVLTNTLVTTEEKTSRQVYNMLSNYQLADAANIARADALQTFNYNFRERMESYLTASSTEATSGQKSFALFTFTKTNSPGFTVDELRANFEKNILLTQGTTNQFQAVLEYVSENTISQFRGDTYGRYSVELDVKPSEISVAKVRMAEAMKSVLEKDFLEVVGCTGSSCPLGTFYFNIPLNKLNNAQYEALPRIVVRDIITNEEIKMAILPKTNIKVYIPIRYFKVLKEASEAAQLIQAEHAEISAFRLGFCSNSCAPNTTPNNANSVTTWGNRECPIGESTSEVDLIPNAAGQKKYLAGGIKAGEVGLWATTVQHLCDKGTGGTMQVFDVDGPSSMSEAERYGGFGVYDNSGGGNKRGASGGYFLDMINGCGFYSLDIRTGAQKTALIQGNATTGNQYLRCGQVEFISAEIAFMETNSNYIVKGTYDDGGADPKDLFIIRVEDRSYDEADEVTSPARVCQSTTTSCG